MPEGRCFTLNPRERAGGQLWAKVAKRPAIGPIRLQGLERRAEGGGRGKIVLGRGGGGGGGVSWEKKWSRKALGTTK